MAFPKHAVIITAAGSSDRFNDQESNVKKEYLSIEGETVLWRATAPFITVPGCSAIIVTHPEGLEAECGIALGDLLEQNQVPIILTPGGESRQDSVYNALSILAKIDLAIEYVAIHDGARCFITPELIIQTLATATVFGGAAPALPTIDTMKIIEENGLIVEHIDRSRSVGVQTPQIFRYPEIWEAHQGALALEKSFTDDTEIYSEAGYTVGVTPGSPDNRKVTYQNDIPDAQEQIATYTEQRAEAEQKIQASERFHQALREFKAEQH